MGAMVIFFFSLSMQLINHPFHPTFCIAANNFFAQFSFYHQCSNHLGVVEQKN
jgi:hypothetical protein